VHAARAAEFFAGIGLVRAALGRSGIEVVWANDVEPVKGRVYAENFGSEHFRLGDVREVRGDDLPDVDMATASFPCTDLSLAGNRQGIWAGESSMFWEFARVLGEMGQRRPRAVLLENVPGFATSHGGRDLRDALHRLNGLGYSCHVFTVDAASFVPQSRLRMFIVGAQAAPTTWPSMQPPVSTATLADVVERLPRADPRWWDTERTTRFVASLSDGQRGRLDMLQQGPTTWRTAYRRTRDGVARWEIRPDAVAGCLRTARGGSSKQAVVEAGQGSAHVRWMTAWEYAALQGAPDHKFASVSENQAMFGFGDAVCVPVVEWIAREYLLPLLNEPVGAAA
jgi:DNA (cytosine-5)-methyltransferase 1